METINVDPESCTRLTEWHLTQRNASSVMSSLGTLSTRRIPTLISGSVSPSHDGPRIRRRVRPKRSERGNDGWEKITHHIVEGLAGATGLHLTAK